MLVTLKPSNVLILFHLILFHCLLQFTKDTIFLLKGGTVFVNVTKYVTEIIVKSLDINYKRIYPLQFRNLPNHFLRSQKFAKMFLTEPDYNVFFSFNARLGSTTLQNSIPIFADYLIRNFYLCYEALEILVQQPLFTLSCLIRWVFRKIFLVLMIITESGNFTLSTHTAVTSLLLQNIKLY